MKNLFTKSRLARELKQLARENQGKALSILDDVVFKAMLTENNEDSREALRSLVSACTRREVSDIRVINNELPPAYYGSKKPRVDVLVTFNDGEVANMEMQTGKTDDDIKKRAEYYKSTLVAGQLTRGKPYSSVKRVYQVFFLNFVLFPNSEKLPRRYFYQEETEHDRLSELSEIILYELPKLKGRLKDYQSGKASVETLTGEEK